ncbi:MAG: M67 family metallopeptidase [Gammaproteobacteria bacterium]|nr:M67 family metallopeptidase [Gammaproteobacteria bacterium]MCK5263033.1 M67 family metallopeptidase [Gammaproteobacteria bacterium]
MKIETNLSLLFPRQLANKILAHAQQNPETEICGLISSQNQHPKHYYPIPNSAENAGLRFHMDEQAQISAMKKMREQNEELLAIVHSHPHSEAIPSALDEQEHQYPDAYYLIVSLNTTGVLDLRAFKQINQRFQPVELILEHPDN